MRALIKNQLATLAQEGSQGKEIPDRNRTKLRLSNTKPNKDPGLSYVIEAAYDCVKASKNGLF